MAGSSLSNHQSRQRQVLDQISNNKDLKLDQILNLINDELTSPLRMRADVTPSQNLNISAITIQTTDGSEGHGRKKVVPVFGGTIPTFTGGYISFPTSSGGNITGSGVTFDTPYTLTVSPSNYIKVLVMMDRTANIRLAFGTQNTTEATATLPRQTGATYAIGYVVLYNNAGTIGTVNDNNIYQFDTVQISDDVVTLRHVSTPSVPPVGYEIIYAKSDGLLYKLDSAGNETLVGSGSGAGEINLLINPDGDTALDGNRTYDVGDWIDYGVGTVSSRTTTTSEIPLYPIKKNAIKITNSGSGVDYTYARFTVPVALLNRKLKVAWEQVVSTSTAYLAGDFKLEIYKNATADYLGAYTLVPLSTDASGVTGIPAANGKFQTTFDTESLGYYELRITRVSGSSNSYICLNNVVVGPGVQPQGAVVTEWQNYTPTLGTGTRATTHTEVARWRRVGSSMEIQYFYRHTSSAGAANGAGGYQFSIPTGYTILQPTGVAASISMDNSSDVGAAQVSTTTSNYVGTVYASSSIHLSIVVSNEVSFGAISDSFNGFASANLIQYTFTASVPISQWVGSGTLNVAQNDVEYAYNSTAWGTDNSTAFAYGPAGAAMGGALGASFTQRVRFQTPPQASDQVVLEVSSDRIRWQPAADATVGGIAIYPMINSAGSAASGCKLQPVSGTVTDFDVYFGRYAQMENDDGGLTNWPSSNAYWRVRKTSAGAAVGFGAATQTSLGLKKIAQPTVFSFDTFSPVDVANTNTNASSRTIDLVGNGGISVSSISSGTVTLTFGSTGSYLVHAIGGHRHSGAYTNADLYFTYGGTASAHYAYNPFTLGPQANNGDGTSSDVIAVEATAGQTFTIQCQGRVAAPGLTTSHAFRGKVIVTAL